MIVRVAHFKEKKVYKRQTCKPILIYFMDDVFIKLKFLLSMFFCHYPSFNINAYKHPLYTYTPQNNVLRTRSLHIISFLQYSTHTHTNTSTRYSGEK